MGLPLKSFKMVTSILAVGGGALYLRPRAWSYCPDHAPRASSEKTQSGHENGKRTLRAMEHGFHCKSFDTRRQQR